MIMIFQVYLQSKEKMSHAVCTDVCVFDIKQLPPEILLMILENLNLEDLKKMRHLDSW